jgi:hypothetical protein
VENLSKEESSTYFKIELFTHPTFTFRQQIFFFFFFFFFFNKDKAELAKAIATSAKYFPANEDIVEDNKQYVLDEGALLQKLPW